MKLLIYLSIFIVIGLLVIGGFFLFKDKGDLQKGKMDFKTNLEYNLNGKEMKVESSCNSGTIKCTTEGCKELC